MSTKSTEGAKREVKSKRYFLCPCEKAELFSSLIEWLFLFETVSNEDVKKTYARKKFDDVLKVSIESLKTILFFTFV